MNHTNNMKKMNLTMEKKMGEHPVISFLDWKKNVFKDKIQGTNILKQKKEYKKFIENYEEIGKKIKKEKEKEKYKDDINNKISYIENCREICREYFSNFVFSIPTDEKQITPFIIIENNNIYSAYSVDILVKTYYNSSIVLQAWPGKWRTDVFHCKVQDFKNWIDKREIIKEK